MVVTHEKGKGGGGGNLGDFECWGGAYDLVEYACENLITVSLVFTACS